MAGEVLLINPRRRRRKRTTRGKAKRTHRRLRRVMVNPRRHRYSRPRRRSSIRRRRHHRIRHNPALAGGKLMQGVMIGVGAVAADTLGGFVQKWIPAAWNLDANVARIGTKAVVGIGAPMLLRKMRALPPNLTNAWMLGGVVVTVLDVFETYVKPNIPGLGEYEYGTVQGYEEPAGLVGEGSADVYGDGIY